MFYLNSELDFSGFRLFDSFARHTEYWLMEKGMPREPVRQQAPQWGCRGGRCPQGGLMLPDYSIPAAAAYWFSACANVTAHPAVDGCNIDRASHLGGFTALPPGSWGPRGGAQAFNTGKLAALQQLQAVVGDGPVIANCHECLTANTTIPGVHSQNLEGFGPREEWIVKMQVLARAGKLAKAHYSTDDADGLGCLNRSHVEHAMATFLLGAGQNSFFSCAHGWTGVSAGGQVEPWVAWLPQYEKPLGPPLGDAVKGPDGVWRRNFSSGTAAFFDPVSDKGQICWAGERCPPFPAPGPPAPPLPLACGQVQVNTGVGGTGTDLHMDKVVPSAVDCCAWCQGNAPRCQMWSWHTEQHNTCHLHTSEGEFKPGVNGAFSAILHP